MTGSPNGEYEFTLVLSGITPESPGVEDALFESGCDDATLAFRFGRPVLTFARTASSFKDAIVTAIGDVRRAKIGGEVLRVDGCDFVSLAEIARRIGRTRQFVHQYQRGQRGPGGFPSPLCTLSEGVLAWSWYEVADWLSQHDMIAPNVLQEARELSTINGILELEFLRRRNADLTAEILRTIGTTARPAPRKRASRGNRRNQKPRPAAPARRDASR